MNYILRKVNCKALILSAFVILLTFTSVTAAYAYTIRRIPSFWFDGKNVFYAEGVSPRQSSYTSVSIGYDNLASLVYYCNENGLSTTLAYNSSLGVYVGWVYDDAFKITSLGVSLASGLLCNSDGKIYTAERENSTSVTVNNFNQTIINNSSGSASGTTGSPSVSSSWQEKELLGKIYEKLWFINEWLQITKDWVKEVNYNVKNVNTNINNNVVPALVAINNNLSSMLTDTASRLSSIQSASWASVDAENRILSTLTGIGNQLGSVIRNGQIQVNTSPLEARLDKLISMYSKVNSVVLDTASINGGQITGAVGGELKDVVFWGMSNQTSLHLYSSPDINYTLNGAAAHIPFTDPSGNTIILRSVPLGSSIPSYISNDPVLLAGVWRSGSTYIISDTLDTSTGVYTQRIKELTLTGSESGYGVRARANGSVLFYRLYTGDGQLAARSSHFTFVNFDSTLSSTGTTSQSIRDCTFTYANGMFCLASTSFTTTAQWTAWLKSHYNAGHPFTLYYVDGPASTWTAAPVSTDNCMTIAIPEGNSTISADLLRITGKYETYDSYTQTADIIAAINNIPPVDLDLTPLSTRLDTLNTAIATVNSNVKNIKSYTNSMKTSLTAVNTALTSVIADGLLKVDNSAVVTALGKLDKLAELPTIKAAVDGVNTTIASVIADGQLKVDNSAVVTALGKLDKLDELPTIKAAVDGVNTTIASVIAQGQLKVDNSAVVAAIEGIQAGTAADLSPVVVRMDAILAELQSAPGSAACEHTYTQHTEQEATCTLPGLLIFTCSQCGDSYSEIVDPLGHDWIVTSHVDAVTDPETGEETASAYDVYTCSRCQRTYEDHDGSGPEEDYSSSSISKLVVKVFSRLGTFAGKLIGSVIHLFDKAITALDNVVSKFNEYVEQISGFGGGYPAWLTGFWGVLPAELQVALTFAVICMALGVVGKKLFFS